MTQADVIQELASKNLSKIRHLVDQAVVLVEADDASVRELKGCLAQLASQLGRILRELESQEIEQTPEVEELFEYWKSHCGHAKARLLPKWVKALRLRLSQYPLDDLKRVVDFATEDPWLSGRDPKAKRAYNGLDTLFSSDAKVEKYLAAYNSKGPRASTWRSNADYESERL